MNSDQIKGQWKIIKGKAKEKWGELTDDDLDKAEGEREQLVGAVQKRYGKTKEQAQKEVDSWMESTK